MGSNGAGNVLPKWLVMGLGGLLIAFVALGVVQKAHDLNSSFKNDRPANTISVSGEGKVTAKPDLATVSIGVLSQGASAVDVKNQNNEKVNKVIAFIKQQGIADADIQTSQFSFYAQQDWKTGTQKIIGYQGNQTVTVKVRGVEKDTTALEKILDGSVNNGANQVDGVNLTVDKPTDLQNEARKLAIADAKKKAKELAQEAGLTLGKVVSVSENSMGGYPVPMAYSTNQALGADMKSSAPDIQTGSQEINETMTLVFEVK